MKVVKQLAAILKKNIGKMVHIAVLAVSLAVMLGSCAKT
jgi:hypothetical protein